MIHDPTHFKRGIDWKEVIIHVFGVIVFGTFLATTCALVYILGILMGA